LQPAAAPAERPAHSQATPNSSCQSTGAPSRHGAASKGAPPVGSVIRTKGATSWFTPATVDIEAHTAAREACSGTSTVSFTA
jgi:hypothetical protein